VFNDAPVHVPVWPHVLCHDALPGTCVSGHWANGPSPTARAAVCTCKHSPTCGSSCVPFAAGAALTTAIGCSEGQEVQRRQMGPALWSVYTCSHPYTLVQMNSRKTHTPDTYLMLRGNSVCADEFTEEELEGFTETGINPMPLAQFTIHPCIAANILRPCIAAQYDGESEWLGASMIVVIVRMRVFACARCACKCRIWAAIQGRGRRGRRHPEGAMNVSVYR
jgi:hypothetical protein